MLQQRRRKATKEELAQDEREMKAAQERLDRELQTAQELPLEDQRQEALEDGKGGASQGTQSHQTPASTAAPVTEDRVQVSGPSTLRTPEVKGPKSSREGTERKEKKVEDEVKSSHPTPRTEGSRVGGKGKGERRDDEEVIPESHSIATPPDPAAPLIPLFSEEQRRGLHEMYQQAPWLYSKFETPQAIAWTPMPTLSRPAFLTEEEGREASERREEEKRKMEMLRQLHERRELERVEKEEMTLQLQRLAKENQTLRDGLAQAESEQNARARQVEEERIQRMLQLLMDENVKLSKRLQSRSKRRKMKRRSPLPMEALSMSQSPQHQPPGMMTKRKAPRNQSRRVRTLEKAKGQRKEKKKKHVNVTLKLVEGMQELRKKVMKNSEHESNEAEVVRGAVELPRLQDWKSETSPIDYADWLLLLHPIMADLSPTSETWWEEVVKVAKDWYVSHMAKTPLDRLGHKAVATPLLNQKRWSRLEKRASALLLTSIPDTLREEVVASKNISTLGILAKGMVLYQPGGLAERQAILSALESVGIAITTLRPWIRWKRRAEELGVSVPDPTILARGLSRLTKKLLSLHPELSFRLQLARSSLMIDSVPTPSSITQYAEHVMAELEQVNQQTKKKNPVTDPPRLKRFEEASKDKKDDKEKKPGDEKKDKAKRRFFLTDARCRRGKGCTFAHDQRDEKRRCWNCGAVDHMAPSCTRPRESKEGNGRPKIAKAEKEKAASGKNEGDGGDDQPSIKDLLKEANEMLKGMNGSPTASSASPSSRGSDHERNEVVEKLQQQLNALKQKTFRLRRMKKGAQEGLLDSGATHPLRPTKKGEDCTEYQKVQVALANGQVVSLPISPGGAMVSQDEDIEPIIPMGLLTERLGCTVQWAKGQLSVCHPSRGQLPVCDRDGCPQLPRKLALQLIEELENVKKGINFEEEEMFEEEMKWMKGLVNAHPVLSRLPKEVKGSLVVRLLVVISGESPRVHAQLGGSEKELIEIDVKRGAEHDVLLDSGPYSALLRAVWEDRLKGLVGGPNCRTRSIMRHYPVEGGNSPRPL